MGGLGSRGHSITSRIGGSCPLEQTGNLKSGHKKASLPVTGIDSLDKGVHVCLRWLKMPTLRSEGLGAPYTKMNDVEDELAKASRTNCGL